MMKKSRTFPLITSMVLCSLSFSSIPVNAVTNDAAYSNNTAASSNNGENSFLRESETTPSIENNLFESSSGEENQVDTNSSGSSESEISPSTSASTDQSGDDTSNSDLKENSIAADQATLDTNSSSIAESTEQSGDGEKNPSLIENDTNDDQAVLDAIGKGDGFNPKLYLNYFGAKLDELFQDTSDKDFVSNFLSLYGDQVKKAKTQFEVDRLRIQQLMSTYILYDIAFAKNSHLMALMPNNDGTAPEEYTGFYPNTSLLKGSSINRQTGKPMNLNAYYVDQKSNKTIIIHGGFRGNWNNGVVTPEYDIFYKAGYNLLFVDPRTTGGSDGDYVTYGQYESDDILFWVNQEVATKPQQGILLYGGSMGATAVMSTLAKPIPQNVKGIIENCGFQSIDAQLRYTYSNLVAPLFAKYSFILNLDMVADQEHEDFYMNLLKENYFNQELHLNTTEELSAIGMSETAIPKLLIHGVDDNVVPASNAQSLYDLSKGYKDLVLIEGAGHGEAQKVDPTTYNTHVDDFLNVVFNDKVKVSYLDENNQSLLSENELVLSGFYGDSFQTTSKSFDGYKLVSIEGEEKGTFSEKTPTVIYRYKKDDTSTSESNNDNQTSDTTNESNEDNKTSDTTSESNNDGNSNYSETTDSEEPPSSSNTTMDAEFKKEDNQFKKEANHKLKSYPKTGEKKSTVIMVVGVGLIAIALGMVYWRKRRG